MLSCDKVIETSVMFGSGPTMHNWHKHCLSEERKEVELTKQKLGYVEPVCCCVGSSLV